MGEILPDGRIQGYSMLCNCGATAPVNIQGEGTCPDCGSKLPQPSGTTQKPDPRRDETLTGKALVEVVRAERGEPDEGSEVWPVVTLSQSLTSLRPEEVEGAPTMTYHPASAPNVLSEEECALLVDVLGPIPVSPDRDRRLEMSRLFRKLTEYAAKGDPK